MLLILLLLRLFIMQLSAAFAAAIFLAPVAPHNFTDTCFINYYVAVILPLFIPVLSLKFVLCSPQSTHSLIRLFIFPMSLQIVISLLLNSSKTQTRHPHSLKLSVTVLFSISLNALVTYHVIFYSISKSSHFILVFNPITLLLLYSALLLHFSNSQNQYS